MLLLMADGAMTHAPVIGGGGGGGGSGGGDHALFVHFAVGCALVVSLILYLI